MREYSDLNMSCLTEGGRFLLITLNVIFMIVGISVFACGILLKWFLGELLKNSIVKTMVESAFREITKDSVVPNTLEFGPLTQGAALALMIIGGILFLLSFMACCGACCQWRPLLWLFSIFLVVFVIAEIVVFTLMLTPNSAIHLNARDALTDTLHLSYRPQTGDPFTATADLVMISMKCCGVSGPDDFFNMSLVYDVNGMEQETEVPPSCCSESVIQTVDYVDCAQNPTTNNTFQIGCYDAMFVKVEPWRSWLITGLVVGVIFQLIEVVCAVYAVKVNKVFPD
ncbi:tetraspanin-18-like [Gigantopelta aegis]|uniref:tetraspanin-18-like n=1 Tax=Gigantopelta aegis TaxID=1735272 RepID=UPI001B88B45C|nr:tetraspanin-18-like [Gigantopelta aegis]